MENKKQDKSNITRALILSAIGGFLALCASPFHSIKGVCEQTPITTPVVQPINNAIVGEGTRGTITNDSSHVLTIVNLSNGHSDLISSGDIFNMSTANYIIAPAYDTEQCFVDIDIDETYRWEGYDLACDSFSVQPVHKNILINDTPYVSGYQIPKFPSDINIANSEIQQMFNISSYNVKSKFHVSAVYFPQNKFSIVSSINELNSNILYDEIIAIYVHSWRDRGFGNYTLHDLISYYAVDNVGQHVTCFAANGNLSPVEKTIDGWNYFACPIDGFMTNKVNWDSVYYGVNRAKTTKEVKLYDKNSVITSLNFQGKNYLDNYFSRSMFTGNFEIPNDIEVTGSANWIQLITLLVASGVSAFAPIFTMTILPGVTLGFLFFLPFFLTLLVIIIKVLKK